MRQPPALVLPLIRVRLPVLFIGLVLLALLGALRLGDPPALQALRLAYFDHLQRLAPRETGTLPVRVVVIDEASLAKLGQWPWPRDRLAALTRRLAEAGAAAIAFDVLFAEPDRLSPLRLTEIPDVARTVGNVLPRDALASLDTDRRFADAISQAPVVLGTARSAASADEPPRPRAEVTLAGTAPGRDLAELGPSTALVPELARAAKGIGVISVGPGTSGAVIRTAPMLWRTPHGLLPSLSLETVRVALGEDGLVLWGAEGRPGGANRISLGPYDIPTTADGQLWLRFRHEDPSAYIPAHAVLSGKSLPDLQGAVVLVGTSAAGLLDLHTTALGETLPGVAVHAQAVEQILAGKHLVRTDYAGGLELLLFVSTGLLVAAAMSLSGPTPSVLVALGAAGATLVASWAGFSGGGLLIDATFPLIGTFLTFSLLALYRLFVTDRDARLIRRSFSHYVAPSVLRIIETGGHKVALGGSDQPATIMFADIRDFTGMSETMDAQEVVTLLNGLFAGLSEEIIARRGTIDKFMGDSVMAFWNAPLPEPDHVRRACHAALAMRTALARFNERRSPKISMGIGLATGMACVGNIGSLNRFNYTVIGETVNAAARLESASRRVEFDILAGLPVRDGARELAWLAAGGLEAKGVRQRLDAAILVGDEEMAAQPAFVALSGAHTELVEALSAGHDPEELLSRCRGLAADFPGLDRFYDAIATRPEDFIR